MNYLILRQILVSGVQISGDIFAMLSSPESLGVFFGLFIGKPLGIVLFVYLGVHFKIIKLPGNVTMTSVLGVGWIAGIGFTMAFLISVLAFDDLQILSSLKIAIILASLISGLVGWARLNRTLDQNKIELHQTTN